LSSAHRRSGKEERGECVQRAGSANRASGAAMALDDVNASFRKAERTKAELESLLEAFVMQKSAPSSVATQQRLSALCTELVNTVRGLRQQVACLPASNRITWDRRASNLEMDSSQLEKQVEKQLGHFYKSQKDTDNRSKLGLDRVSKDESDQMSGLFKEKNSLAQSSAMLDDILGQGKATLTNLSNQNGVLKGAQKKMLEVTSAIGVSNSLVGVIERRNKGDKWLVYGGMVLTLFILLSLWYLIRR